MTEREKMVAGEMYRPDDAELVALRLRARQLVRRYNDSADDDAAGRRAILGELFGRVGDGPTIEPDFRCDYGFNITVGDRFYANFGCVILDVCPVTFGDDCMLAPGVHVYAATHPIDPQQRISGRELGKPVTIGHRVWLGGSTLVLPGVTIGDDAVIGAGSVVTRDIPPRVVAAGNPCRVLREIA